MKGYYLAPDASSLNFGGNDCLIVCPEEPRSIVYASLKIDPDTNQVINLKKNTCFTDNEIPFKVDECLYYGPPLLFDHATISDLSSTNKCFFCYSYTFTVLNLLDNGLNGNH
jgi:hypothetical protein